MAVVVRHFGGNGHAAVRMEALHEALAGRHPAIRLADVPYPGFEGRPRATSLDAFLDGLAASCRDLAPTRAAVASGIGGLIALALRSRGELADVPLILQGPVLWGLERRAFPRVMRWRLPRLLLERAFQMRAFQRRFARKHFRTPQDPETLARFFDGYARCAAFADFFEWFTPEFLRNLERRFRDRPAALENVSVWWGGLDRVVTPEELRVTERALGVRWPLRTFPAWGHYPTLDVPEEWADALADELEAAARLPRQGRAEAPQPADRGEGRV